MMCLKAGKKIHKTPVNLILLSGEVNSVARQKQMSIVLPDLSVLAFYIAGCGFSFVMKDRQQLCAATKPREEAEWQK